MPEYKNIWIGLFIVVFGGIILLSIEYGFFKKTNGESSSIESNSSEPTKIQESINEQSLKIIRISSESLTPKDIQERSDKIRELFSVADRLYGTTARNKAFAKLNEAAISIHSLDLALKIAGKLYGVSDRNEGFSKIVDAAISIKDFKFAEQAANKLYGETARNKGLNKILAVQVNGLMQ